MKLFFQKNIKPALNVKTLLTIFGLAFLLLQLPFIKADPDIEISWSRGANTDEGLHACQIRNYIHHGKFDLTESDNFIKTPLFGAYLYLPLLVMGSSLSVARWAVLLPFFVLLMAVGWRNSYFVKLLLFFIPLVLLEYHIFHFAHFSLAEMPANFLIFSAILLLAHPVRQHDVRKRGAWVGLLLASAFLLKIQFLYIVLLLPILWAIYFLKKSTKHLQIRKTLFFGNVIIVGILLGYVLLWYLPHQDFFNYVMADQTSSRFAKFSNLIGHVDWINKHLLLGKNLYPITASFYVLFPAGIFLCLKKNTQTEFKKIFLGLSIWWLLESHKILMVYLPTRYLLAFIFCMAAINALVIFELVRLFFEKNKYKKWAFIPLAVFAILLLFNFKNYDASLDRRTYSIRKINQYLARYEFGDRPIIGAWAPSLTWKTNARSYPVWGKYFNDENVLDRQKPAVIIAEMNEEDSSRAYELQGIEIDLHADSIHYFQIHNYQLKLLWMKEF